MNRSLFVIALVSFGVSFPSLGSFQSSIVPAKVETHVQGNQPAVEVEQPVVEESSRRVKKGVGPDASVDPRTKLRIETPKDTSELKDWKAIHKQLGAMGIIMSGYAAGAKKDRSMREKYMESEIDYLGGLADFSMKMLKTLAADEQMRKMVKGAISAAFKDSKNPQKQIAKLMNGLQKKDRNFKQSNKLRVGLEKLHEALWPLVEEKYGKKKSKVVGEQG